MKEWNARKIVDLLWKGKFLILILVVIGALIGLLINTKFTKPTYESTSSIILSVSKESADDIIEDSDKTSISAELSLNERLMNTYAEIIKSESVLNKVIANLNLNVKAKDLVNNISVYPEQKSAVLKITAEAYDPQEAYNVVKELDKVFLDRIEELYNIKSAKVLDEPILDDAPNNIAPKKYLFIGAIVGFALAFFISIIKEYFNENLRTEEDVEKYTHLPVVGNINHFNDKETALVALDKNNLNTESFRVLISNIMYLNKKTILVTSNTPGEGKSIISANLALTYASSGKKTLLIDSDMRKGTQHLLFDIENNSGLSNLISKNNSNFYNVVCKSVTNNLDVLTKGTANLNYSKLLFSDIIKKILIRADEKYDIIIIDGTPSSLVADGTTLYKLVDSTIVVVKYNNTKSSDVNKIKKSIIKNNGSVLGVVINDIPKVVNGYRKYSYYDNDMALMKTRK